MKTAKLSVLPIKDLNPAEYNPRKRLKPGDKEYEKIKHSIEELIYQSQAAYLQRNH